MPASKWPKDPVGEKWQAEADRRWQLALARADEQELSALELFEPVPLPDFAAQRSPHVSREVLGRFLLDRDTGLVHDVATARPACQLDAIANATFIHFGHELHGLEAEPHSCMRRS
jgi:hypothetical protein